MSTDKGYIKLYRDIREHWIWSEKPFDRARAWIDLIMLANHKEGTVLFEGRPLTIKRGQHMTSLTILAGRWGWSRSKVKRFLDDLKAEHMISTLRNSRGTLVTIEKYGIYQDARNTSRNDKKTMASARKNDGEHKQERTEECKKKEEEKRFIEEDLTDDELRAQGWTVW